MAVDDRRQHDGKSGAALQRRRTDKPLPPAALAIPRPLLVLDGIGAVAIGFGAAEHFGKLQLLSRIVDRPDIGLIAMGAGGVLMGIAVIGIIVTVMRRRTPR